VFRGRGASRAASRRAAKAAKVECDLTGICTHVPVSARNQDPLRDRGNGVSTGATNQFPARTPYTLPGALRFR